LTAFGSAMPPFTQLADDVRRLVAPNPSMMTGPGTNTYLFGAADCAVLDPGPAISAHVDNIIAQGAGAIRWILVTHTHPDHSPAAALLAREIDAEVLGMAAPNGEHQDKTFVPDRQLVDGDVLETREFCLHAIHTPGHASNHLCYRHAAMDWIFTGDHVIAGSTVVIDPPDGDMQHYIESLQRLRELRCAALAPGHGDVINDPDRVIDWIIEHRLQREAKIVAAVAAHPNHTPRDLVPHVYKDVDPKLYGWAERSLLAHLLKLEADARAVQKNGRWHVQA